MHELTLVKGMLDIALLEADRHAAKRIKSIKVLLVEHSHLDPASLSFCFEVASRGSLAEGATLDIERVKPATKCVTCETIWTPTDSSLCCPSCGQDGGELIGGEELLLDSLEVEC